MPILKPDVQKALRAAGLQKTDSDSSLVEKLDDHELSLNEVLAELSFLIRNTSNESLKKSALDTALKLHGALKEQAAPLPSITIIIKDPAGEFNNAVNPILIPRKSATFESQQTLPDKEEIVQ